MGNETSAREPVSPPFIFPSVPFPLISTFCTCPFCLFLHPSPWRLSSHTFPKTDSLFSTCCAGSRRPKLALRPYPFPLVQNLGRFFFLSYRMLALLDLPLLDICIVAVQNSISSLNAYHFFCLSSLSTLFPPLPLYRPMIKGITCPDAPSAAVFTSPLFLIRLGISFPI